MIRRCDKCGWRLHGKKFHGFVSADGKIVTCGCTHGFWKGKFKEKEEKSDWKSHKAT